MDMIGHQAVAQDAAGVLPRPFGEQRQINLMALLGVEDFLAVVAPLGDVVRCADRHHARGSQHETNFSSGWDAVNRRAPG